MLAGLIYIAIHFNLLSLYIHRGHQMFIHFICQFSFSLSDIFQQDLGNMVGLSLSKCIKVFLHAKEAAQIWMHINKYDNIHI